MKIKIGCGIILVALLYFSIKIILFSGPDLQKSKKTSRKYQDITGNFIVNTETKKEETTPELESFYRQLFLLKGRKIKKSKDFVNNYKIFKKALFFFKQKNYMAAKRRLEHVTSFLDDSYMPDLLLKTKCYIMLAEIFEKKEIIVYEHKYMDKWYATWKKLCKHKDAAFYREVLSSRSFLMKKIAKIGKEGINEK